MAFSFNIFTQKLDYYDSSFKGILSIDPASPDQGWTYINSTNHGYYIYYGGAWQLLHTLTPAENVDLTNEDGTTLTNEDGTTLQREP
jgi:hypothetical protein